MDQHSRRFVGLDVAKLKISVAVADGERGGEVRFFGDIPSDPASVANVVQKLAKRGAKLHFCYEAGPTGYELYRQLSEMDHDCVVVAPALIPKRPGDRVKTNRRDAVSLARLHRAGELTAVWVPDRGHEAMRDLVRAREAAQAGGSKAGASAASVVPPSTWPRLFGPLILVAGAYAVDIDSEVRASGALHRAQGILPGDRGCRGAVEASDRSDIGDCQILDDGSCC